MSGNLFFLSFSQSVEACDLLRLTDGCCFYGTGDDAEPSVMYSVHFVGVGFCSGGPRRHAILHNGTD